MKKLVHTVGIIIICQLSSTSVATGVSPPSLKLAYTGLYLVVASLGATASLTDRLQFLRLNEVNPVIGFCAT